MSIYILSISIVSLIKEMYREKAIVLMLELLTCVEFFFLGLLGYDYVCHMGTQTVLYRHLFSYGTECKVSHQNIREK